MAANKPLIYDSADKTPPIPVRVPHHMIGYGDVPRAERAPLVSFLPWPAWCVGGVLALIFGGFLVYRLDQFWRSFSSEHPIWSETIAFSCTIAIILTVIYWLAGRAVWSVYRARAEAFQALVSRTRLGVPIAADVASTASWQEVVDSETAHINLQTAIAPYQQWPLLSTNAASKENNETVVYGAGDEPTATPIDPAAGPLLTQLRKRYGRSAEHLFVGSVGDTPIYLRWGMAGVSAIIGGSGGGKTNTARLIAAWHALNGGGLALCDGHGEVRDESLIDSCQALSEAYILPPAISNDAIYATIKRMDAIARARISGTEAKDMPLLLIIDEFISLCRNHPRASEIVNMLVNFGDEYRKVNCQALLTAHHGRGDVIDDKLGTVIRSTVGTRIVHNTSMNEARYWLKANEAQGVDRLRPGEALFFDRASDVQKIVVPWLPPEALREVAYPLHPGWPLSIDTPQDQQRSARQILLDNVRRRMEQAPRAERLRVADLLALKGAKQQEIAYACKLSDEAAGAAWRLYHGG